MILDILDAEGVNVVTLMHCTIDMEKLTLREAYKGCCNITHNTNTYVEEEVINSFMYDGSYYDIYKFHVTYVVPTNNIGSGLSIDKMEIIYEFCYSKSKNRINKINRII